ncbi:aminoglycoside phosphotransferase family protein [Alteribacter populi]|uniref:aminoglycoside phosphotransferase family protein n=1 Tax=Alteribacter populi TaxID=2011011 RepID=UPI0012FF9C61|nr:aminoglycoside phosphotransferase family protein [Alteribacter populi]
MIKLYSKATECVSNCSTVHKKLHCFTPLDIIVKGVFLWGKNLKLINGLKKLRELVLIRFKIRKERKMTDKQNELVSKFVQQKAKSLGYEGEKWLYHLKDTIYDLEQRWGIRIEKTLEGGSEAFVAEVSAHDGGNAILKLVMPQMEGNSVLEQEVEALRIVNGDGYVRLINEDMNQRALLLERLGKPLHQLGYSTKEEIKIICSTLKQSWKPIQQSHHLQSIHDLIEWFTNFIPALWKDLGKPCSKELIDQSLTFLESRLTNIDLKKAVLVHGDAHSGNILQNPTEPQPLFKLIDPDGLIAEPSYDLGILMREWLDDLIEDPLENGKIRCSLLGQLTGEDTQGIWEWGYIQSISTGLFLIKIGEEPFGYKMLKVAEAWKETRL